MNHFFGRLSRRDFKAVMLLGLIAIALHGHGLGLGFWLDDHNHLELCRANGYSGLVSGNTFDWNRRIAHVWWATKETGWAYFRPFTVALRTVQLEIFGLNPFSFHVVYLAIYVLSVGLFYGVIRRWGGSTGMALVAGLLFTMHPSHSMTAAWLACDGPVLVGVWTFLALWLLHALVEAEYRRAWLWLGIFICYGMAMLSRESGVMLGPMLVICAWMATCHRTGKLRRTNELAVANSFQPSSGPNNGSREIRQWCFYAALAFEAITFLLIRSHFLHGAPAPRSPYFKWPSEPGFVSWILHKCLSDFLCLTLGLPSFPIVNIGWLQERPMTTLGFVILAVAISFGILYTMRRSRAAWAIIACMFLAAAPTLPALSAAYHYYLVSAGWAALLAMWGRELWHGRPRLVAAAFSLLSVIYLTGLWSGAWMLYASSASERMVRDSVAASDAARYPPGTRLFFINLPFFASESGPAIRLAAQRPDLDFCPLTYAPSPFLPNRSVSVIQENERTLLVQIDPPGWFSGRFGDQVALGWFGASRRNFPVGPVQIAPVAGWLPFRVEVVAADSRGITAFRFVFDKPVNDPGYRFFLGTSNQCAQLLHFSGGTQPVAIEPGSPQQEHTMKRLRRMQIAFDRVTKFLARWP